MSSSPASCTASSRENETYRDALSVERQRNADLQQFAVAGQTVRGQAALGFTAALAAVGPAFLPWEAAVTAQHIAPVIPRRPSRRARSAAGRTLPLARPVRSAAQGVVYGLARIDASRRICERAVITALG